MELKIQVRGKKNVQTLKKATRKKLRKQVLSYQTSMYKQLFNNAKGKENHNIKHDMNNQKRRDSTNCRDGGIKDNDSLLLKLCKCYSRYHQNRASFFTLEQTGPIKQILLEDDHGNDLELLTSFSSTNFRINVVEMMTREQQTMVLKYGIDCENSNTHLAAKNKFLIKYLELWKILLLKVKVI